MKKPIRPPASIPRGPRLKRHRLQARAAMQNKCEIQLL